MPKPAVSASSVQRAPVWSGGTTSAEPLPVARHDIYRNEMQRRRNPPLFESCAVNKTENARAQQITPMSIRHPVMAAQQEGGACGARRRAPAVPPAMPPAARIMENTEWKRLVLHRPESSKRRKHVTSVQPRAFAGEDCQDRPTIRPQNMATVVYKDMPRSARQDS